VWQGFIGILVGAGFGLAFVVSNTHPPLPDALSLLLRALGAAALVGTVALGLRAARHDDASLPTRYGRRFWLIVAAEVVLLVVGLQVRRLLDAPEEANVAWIACVVGLHFIAFRWVWQTPSIAVPGALLTLLGAAGLVLSATPAVAWVPLISGVASGFVLLAACLVAVGRQAQPQS
jgi:hypothetical protein